MSVPLANKGAGAVILADLSALGLRTSRVLRFWPLAMAASFADMSPCLRLKGTNHKLYIYLQGLQRVAYANLAGFKHTRIDAAVAAHRIITAGAKGFFHA